MIVGQTAGSLRPCRICNYVSQSPAVVGGVRHPCSQMESRFGLISLRLLSVLDDLRSCVGDLSHAAANRLEHSNGLARLAGFATLYRIASLYRQLRRQVLRCSLLP